MSRLIRPLLSITLSLICAGGCNNSDFVSEAQSTPPIIGGSVDKDHTAVVALTYQGQQFCSGTLIAPRVVLSAGHCMMDSDFLPSEIAVFFGDKVGGTGTSVKAVDWQAHPDYYLLDNGVPVYDISVITLAQDAPVAPMAWQSSTLPDIVGKSLLMVGYGVTNANTQTGNGTRRKVTEVVTEQDEGFLYRGNSKTGTCQGDSGGPALLDENGTLTVVAVTTAGDYSCVNIGIHTRVDTYASFISQFIKSCTPNCSGKQCGSDGCGGTCGTCSTGTCDASGKCISTCTPNCSGKQCGDDGCGGTCGTCSNGTCDSSGQCVTTPSTCRHSVCNTGAKLTTGCSDCATAICAVDSYCCSTKWDSQCVSEVAQYCSESC